MRKRNKAARMEKLINPEDPIFVVAISPKLVGEIETGCERVDSLISEFEKLLGF